MKAITRFEMLMESMVERGFARLLRTRMQPIEIAKKLSREMEAQRTVAINRVLVPNYYTAALSAEDFDHFAPIQATLQREMAVYLTDYAAEHQYTLPGEAGVTLVRDPSLRAGGLKITVRMEDLGEEWSDGTTPLAPTQLMPAPDAPPPVTPASRRPGPPMRARIDLQGASCFLDQDVASLGRGLDNDVVVDDTRVSRLHARLQRGSRGWELTDLASTNGTFVNGKQIKQHAVVNGDTISLGGLEMKFFLDTPKR
ncbi:MAG: FhaA domain-containing protein [Chloroflexota bacterium]